MAYSLYWLSWWLKVCTKLTILSWYITWIQRVLFIGVGLLFYSFSNCIDTSRTFSFELFTKLIVAILDTRPPLNWQKSVWNLDSSNPNNNGYKNEDLMVWMRTAALPTFRKLYRRVDHVGVFENGLPAGNYTLRIEYGEFKYLLSFILFRFIDLFVQVILLCFIRNQQTVIMAATLIDSGLYVLPRQTERARKYFTRLRDYTSYLIITYTHRVVLEYASRLCGSAIDVTVFLIVGRC